jgi:hypothetical protein
VSPAQVILDGISLGMYRLNLFYFQIDAKLGADSALVVCLAARLIQTLERHTAFPSHGHMSTEARAAATRYGVGL